MAVCGIVGAVEVELVEEDGGLVVIDELIRGDAWSAVPGEQTRAWYTLSADEGKDRQQTNNGRARKERRGRHCDSLLVEDAGNRTKGKGKRSGGQRRRSLT